MAKRPIKRISRMQPQEEVLTWFQQMVKKAEHYGKWLAGGAGVIILALVVWMVVAHYQAQKEEQADAALAAKLPQLGQSQAPAPALKDMEEIIREYPGTAAAREAQLFRAHLLYQEKKYKEAAQAYEAVQGKFPALNPLITGALSYCYEAQGDYRQAAALLKPLAEKSTGVQKGELTWRLARLLEAAGDKAEARRYYQLLVESPPEPGLKPYMQEKVAALKGEEPKSK